MNIQSTTNCHWLKTKLSHQKQNMLIKISQIWKCKTCLWKTVLCHKKNFIFYYIFYCCSITVVPTFPPMLSSTHLTYPFHFYSQFPPCCPCTWFIHTCSLTSPFPFFPPLSSSSHPSGHCQSFPCFHVSGSILLICFVH